jgi:hypothetical protein
MNEFEKCLDPNYKATLYYNLACCYQRLGMLEECVDYLELATKSLNKKIIMLEEEENSLLFNTVNTDSNSIDGDIILSGGTGGPTINGQNKGNNYKLSLNSVNDKKHNHFSPTETNKITE